MKECVNQLAIFGGKEEFSAPLHVGRPNIGNREKLMERLSEMLDRRWLSNNGPFVVEFEKALCDFLGAKHCIVMCNATIALEITSRAIGLSGEVIVPSFTFVATPHSLQWQEITPVFCDIDPETHNIDPKKVEALITPRTSGIMGVHVWGRPCDIDALAEIAARRNLRLMFDAAHAFGCSYKGQMIGNFGDAEVFSFHATKFFNSFEGGAVVTNNDDLAQKVRLMTNFGFAGYDSVIYLGTNGKMNEASAAMGLNSLESLDEFIHVNHDNYCTYMRLIKGTPGIRFIEYDERERNNFQYIIVEIDEAVTGISRDDIVRVLHAEKVLARKYFYPGCHQMEPYRSYFPHAGLLLPETERMVKKTMSLPNGTAVNVEDVEKICHLIHFILKNKDEIKARLAS